MTYDVLVIGAGPAGMTAGIYAKRANLKVAVIEKGAPGGQIVNTAEIENYTGFKKLSGFELAIQMFEHTRDIGVETIFDEVVEVIDEGEIKTVVLKNQRLKTRAVLIATGAIPKTLGVKGEQRFTSNGISWCAICDGPLYKDKKLVVVGGGNSAVEESSFLTTIATHVTLVQNLDYLTADEKAQETLKKAKNIDFKYNSKVVEFVGESGLEGVWIESDKGEKTFIEADGVFEYVGLSPVVGMVKNLNIIDKTGYIKVNEKMETEVSGIYAAGDVVVKQIRQVVTAVNDGAIAVQNILKYLES